MFPGVLVAITAMYVMKQFAHCRNVYWSLWPGCTRPSSGKSWNLSDVASHSLSSSAVGNQLIEVDVFPVGHFVNQAFGKDGEACTDIILALMVCVYSGVSRGC